MSTTESNLIACAIKKLKQIAADEMADGVHISGRTAEAIDVVLAEIERLTRERDKLIEAWPTIQPSGRDHRWWAVAETLWRGTFSESVTGDTREAAVRAAAGIATTQQESKP